MRPAARLFGENPAAFPTVTGQLAFAGNEARPEVGLVILNGGINDVDFEEVLDPDGPSPAEINRAIDEVFGRALADLLTATRRRFPHAFVIVPGYFAALTNASDRGDLKTLFEYLSEKPAWQLAVNDVIQGLPLLNDVFEALGLSRDVGALVRSAIRRTVSAAAYAHFRTRATIAGLPPGVTEPGLIYAHPAFRAEHALFAGEQSLVYGGYRFPGHGRLSAADEMLETRRARIPRGGLLGDYHDLDAACSRLRLRRRQEQSPNSAGAAGESSVSLARKLHAEFRALVDAHPELPTELLLLARGGAELPDDHVARLQTLVRTEIGRIEVATIASFIHPNPAGARRYADRIVLAHQRSRMFSMRREVRRLVPAGPAVSLRRAFTLHGGDLRRGLARLARVTFVESVAIELAGLPTVPPLLRKQTRPATITLGAGVSIDAVLPVGRGGADPPGMIFAFDPDREVHLGEISEFTIRGGPAFTEVVLYLNGHEFLRRRRVDGTVHADAIRFAL